MNMKLHFWNGLCALGLTAVALAVVAPVALADVGNPGSLDAFGPEGERLGLCPLERTDVEVDISGFIARVTLTQHFTNPYEEPIEAVYTFPMSDRGAVDSMTMTIGDRVIKGIIEERDVARQIYENAKAAGKAASLLDQERPNIFTQSVANITPGEEIDITISYVEFLKYDEGEYEFSFPMVVGPRYNPSPIAPPYEKRALIDPVPDRDRISPPVTSEGTRAGHDISLRVNLDAGVPMHDVRSELHEVAMARLSDSRSRIELKQRNEIPNRDFVLSYAVAGGKIADAVLTHRDERGGYFTLILQPPDRVAPDAVTPKEMIFVIDCSGSMSGFPIEKAKKAMRLAIEQMNPNDTFNLISFAGGLGYCFDGPVPNTKENRARALEYLQNLQGGGGTEMMPAIHAALGGRGDKERLRVVCFMTDGFIGNDMAILDAIQKHRQTARVFSFGIGNGVNRFLIEGMAREGRGAAEVITLDSDGDTAAKRFHERIHSPLLTDIRLDFGDLEILDVYPDPEKMPDLFSSQPLVITGRYTKPGTDYITIAGRTPAGNFQRKVRVELPETAEDHDVLAPLWAMSRIDDLMARDWAGTQVGSPIPDVQAKITKLGLEYSLVTQFTSFVAVEERVVNEGGVTRTVQVPVEMTDGVSYEGVFGRDEKVAAAGSAVRAGASVQPQVLFSTPSPAEVRAQAGSAGGGFGGKARAFADTVAQAPASRGEVLYEADGGGRVFVPADGEPASDELEEDKPQNDLIVLSKLDRSLWNIERRVAEGFFNEKSLTVENGTVKVFIRLADDSDRALAALKAAGVDIISLLRSSKTVYARIKLSKVDEIALLDVVKRIEPPVF